MNKFLGSIFGFLNTIIGSVLTIVVGVFTQIIFPLVAFLVSLIVIPYLTYLIAFESVNFDEGVPPSLAVKLFLISGLAIIFVALVSYLSSYFSEDDEYIIEDLHNTHPEVPPGAFIDLSESIRPSGKK